MALKPDYSYSIQSIKSYCMALSAEWIRDPSYNVKNPIGTDKGSKIKHVARIFGFKAQHLKDLHLCGEIKWIKPEQNRLVYCPCVLTIHIDSSRVLYGLAVVFVTSQTTLECKCSGGKPLLHFHIFLLLSYFTFWNFFNRTERVNRRILREPFNKRCNGQVIAFWQSEWKYFHWKA